MSGTSRLLAMVQLGSSNGTVYDPGAVGHIGQGETAEIQLIILANNDGSDRATTLSYVPAGETLADVNNIVPASVMKAHEACWVTGKLPMKYGDTIQGFAAVADKVNVQLFGEAPTSPR